MGTRRQRAADPDERRPDERAHRDAALAADRRAARTARHPDFRRTGDASVRAVLRRGGLSHQLRRAGGAVALAGATGRGTAALPVYGRGLWHPRRARVRSTAGSSRAAAIGPPTVFTRKSPCEGPYGTKAISCVSRLPRRRSRRLAMTTSGEGRLGAAAPPNDGPG